MSVSNKISFLSLHSLEELVIISNFYRAQYGIGIAAEFVRRHPKTNSKQYRTCTTERSGPGGWI